MRENLLDPESVGIDSSRLSRVQTKIKKDIAQGRYDGAALIVARHGVPVLEICEGFADRSAGKALKDDFTFHLFSLSKQFTAALALKLVEAGVFRLTTPISEFIPEFGGAGKQTVNVYHLLTQTSGLPNNTPEITPEVKANLEAFARWVFDKPLNSSPGERCAYSRSIAHSVLGLFIERATGQTFAKLMQTEIFDPLGLTSTSIGPRDDIIGRLCPANASHQVRTSDNPSLRAYQDEVKYVASAFLIPGCVNPGGCIFSSVNDVHRFAQMLLGRGSLRGVRILSPAMIDLISINRTGTSPNDATLPYFKVYNWMELPANIGIGFFLRGNGLTHGPFGTLNFPRSIGGVGMGSTALWVDPDLDLSFSFLSTGLMDEGDNWSRTSTLSDLVISSIIDPPKRSET